jgi:hypothetical protein
MTLTCQPVRVATGFDEESMSVFDGGKRLVGDPDAMFGAA